MRRSNVSYIGPKSESRELLNKTGTSKVGAISEAQKAQDFFLKKKPKFLIFFLSENAA